MPRAGVGGLFGAGPANSPLASAWLADILVRNGGRPFLSGNARDFVASNYLLHTPARLPCYVEEVGIPQIG